jgi:hypothetical protein
MKPLTPEQQELVIRNIDLAEIAAAKTLPWYRRDRSRDEAFQQLEASAMFGLCRAASLFRSGMNFRSYALTQCIQQIIKDQRADTAIHVPKYLREKPREYKRPTHGNRQHGSRESMLAALKVHCLSPEVLAEIPEPDENEPVESVRIELTKSEKKQVWRLLKRLREGKPVLPEQVPMRLRPVS